LRLAVFEECIAKAREAVRLLERTGDLWESDIARIQQAAALYRLGDLAGRSMASGITVWRCHRRRAGVGISLDVCRAPLLASCRST